MDDRLMYRRAFYVGGRWVPPAGDERLGVVSPSTEQVVGEVPLATPADIDRAVTAARTAFDDGPWPRMTPGERAAVLTRAAELVRKREADIAGITVDEMGCAISQAPTAQTGLVARVFDAEGCASYRWMGPIRTMRIEVPFGCYIHVRSVTCRTARAASSSSQGRTGSATGPTASVNSCHTSPGRPWPSVWPVYSWRPTPIRSRPSATDRMPGRWAG